MNSENRFNWTNHISNVAVLIGIALLLVELNQNNSLVRAQIHQARTDSVVAQRHANADSEYIAPIFQKLGSPGNIENIDSLTPIEIIRLRELHESILSNIDNMHYQYQEGYLDEEYWEYRIIPILRDFVPMWHTLDIVDGNRPSFIEEIEKY